MRILIVTQYFYPESFQINELASTLRSKGHELVVVTGQPNYPSGRLFPGYSTLAPLQEDHHGIKLIRVPIIPRGSGGSWNLALNYISFAFCATLFGIARVKTDIDCCLVYCPSPITAAIPAIVYSRIWKKPVALWIQDLWPESVSAIIGPGRGCLNWLLNRLVNWIYGNVDQIWVQSTAYIESVAARTDALNRIVYVPNWADDIYDCENWDHVTPEPLPDTSLVFAGNIGRAHGLEVILEAAQALAATMPTVHWIFVGAGRALPWLEDEVAKRRLTNCVTLLPWRPAHEMPRILKSAAALLISLRDEDVFAQTVPSRVQSCLAAGRPIIAAVSGESARIIDAAKCGYVCPPRDAEALSVSVKDLLSLPLQHRECLGRNGHRYYVDHFRKADRVSQIEELLAGLSTNKPLR